MDEKSRSFLLLALPLLLSACGGPESEPSTKETPSSDLISSTDLNSSTNPVSSDDASLTTSEDSKTSIDYTIGWDEDILEVMEPHLGGHAIPFIDLPGRKLATWIEASSSYDYSSGGYITEKAHLSIVSIGAFDAPLAESARSTYKRAGWEVEFDRTDMSMHAEETSLGIKVDFYGVLDTNSNMLNPQIDVFYDEPFIIPSDGKWRPATVQLLNSIGIASPHELPYVYLGTLAEEASIYSSNAITIQGLKGGWTRYENEIKAAAKKAFPLSKKWVESVESVTISDSYYYPSTMTGIGFTKNFSDGYTIKAILYGYGTSSYYSSSEGATAYLRVSCTHI